jgi:capsular polysaccharide transport system permease protein
VGLRRRLALPTGFWLIVALPTATSAVYFGAIASDVYVSESKFVVRMPQRQQQPSLMGALLQGSGFMRSQDDTFSVHEYMLSRDALTALDSQLGVRAAFAASAVDLLSRFPAPWSDDSFEALYRYYGQRASVSFDAATSISTLRITAFSAKDAHAINAQLLQLGEDLVNRINTRGRGDLIRFAQAEVTQAERRAQAAAAAVTSFRNQRAVYDPDRQSALQLQGVSKVHEELAAARGQLAQVVQAAPQNPQLPSLRLRVQQLEQTLASENARVTGGSGSLTSKSADYDRLALERGFAERQLASALAALETARNEAQRQQLYLERVVQPNLPDHAIEPRRMRSVLATGVLCLLLWGVVSLLLAAVREHRN